jgi:NhaP-type Na+/H+ and K+/H+ antiporter
MGNAENLSVAAMLMAVGGLVFLAYLFQSAFQRFRVPDTLWLIGIGLVAGPVTHWLQPKDFGIVGPALTAIALAVILFEAGLDLRYRGSLQLTLSAHPTFRWSMTGEKLPSSTTCDRMRGANFRFGVTAPLQSQP